MSQSNPLNVVAALVDWVGALSPEAAFLFALPFLVAALGLVAEWWRSRRRGAPVPRYASKPRASLRRIG